MKMEEILDLIKGLAQSQGMYGRLYAELMRLKEEEPENYEEVKKDWEARNFKNSLDFILFFECGE